MFQVRVSGDKQIVKYLFVQKNPQKCSENCMINILNSLKHSGTKTVPLVSGEWKHSHRSTMSPPKALNSKTTSDRVETRRRKKNTQWHVCPSLQHTHTHTHTHLTHSIRMFTTERKNTHSRRCFGNAFNQTTNQNSRERKVQKTGNRNSRYETMWTEPNKLH